jgi:hypothetical protein
MRHPNSLALALVPRTSRARKTLSLSHVRDVMTDLFGAHLHAARVLSLANGVAGLLSAAVLSLHAIGHAYAQLAGITSKSGIKQVDRMVGNDAISMDKLMSAWLGHVVSGASQVYVAMDWTDFDDDDHTTLCIYQVTSHGRALPLCWKTTRKSQLKTQRTRIELELVEAMNSWLPANTRVVLLADRGFGYQELYDFLGTLGWDYVIRFRQDIYVESEQGERRKASAWVANNGRAQMLPRARVTTERTQVPAVVTVKKARMKEAWSLATSLCDESSSHVVALYGRRFTIEETFRDTKDLHFGMGLRATHIKGTARRDRMLMLVAIAHTLLTLLGAASEASGLDKYLKANTSKKRTLSLYRQGLYWYTCIPTMREEWLVRLMDAYERIVREERLLRELLAMD